MNSPAVVRRNAEVGRLNRLAGLNFEFRVLRALKKTCKWAIRPEGSHGPFDVIAMMKNGKLLLVSCKKNGYHSPKERLVIERYKDKAMIYEVIKLAYYTSPKKWKLERV